MSEIRNLVEPAIARWAAMRATSSDLARIEQALNEMVAFAQERQAFNEADVRFHEAVLAAVHNPIMQQLSVVISALLRAVFERTYMPDENNMPGTLREHQVLYDAIRLQQPDRAGAASIALINAVANITGLTFPPIMGRIKDVTHSYDAALIAVAVALVLGGLLGLILGRKRSMLRTSQEGLAPVAK